MVIDGKVQKSEHMSVVPVALPALAADGNFQTNDAELSGLLDDARKIAGDKWAVIYTSKITNRVVRSNNLTTSVWIDPLRF